MSGKGQSRRDAMQIFYESPGDRGFRLTNDKYVIYL